MLPLTFHPRTHRNRNLRLFHRLPTAGDGQDPPGGHLSTAVPVPPLARPVGKKEQAAPAFLIPACVDPGGRDSLGRGLDAGSIAAVAADPAVQREPDALPQHLSGAYRDPHAAKARLDEMVKRQGWTSTAARVAQDRAQLGDLRGKVGFFAGARAKAERASAERAAELGRTQSGVYRCGRSQGRTNLPRIAEPARQRGRTPAQGSWQEPRSSGGRDGIGGGVGCCGTCRSCGDSWHDAAPAQS